jgi:DUF4097 and DUF4098 domain-containing protein YvlB
MTRRASVIGPLILVLIGVVFLLRNLIPEIHIGDLIASYWPYLLIVWGVLRLAEIGFWAVTSKPLPRNGVSGGEWVLVVFLCIFGSAFHAARHYTGWFPDGRSLRGLVVNMGEPFDYTIDPIEKACSKTPRVIIENFRGNAHIAGGDVQTVKVGAHKRIRSFQQADADRANTDTPLELVAQGEDILVRTNQDRVQDSMRVEEDLDITVPKGASVEAHGRYGDFDITDLGGTVEISSDNAGVRLQNIGGNVRVDLRKSDVVRAVGVKGNVDLKGRGNDIELQDIDGQVSVNGTFVGQVQLRNLAKPLRYEGSTVQLNAEKIPGQVRFEPGEFTGSNLVGPVRLSASSTDVQITEFTQSLDLSLSRTGNVDLRPGSAVPKMDVHTNSGDIQLALSPAAKFDLRMSTERGEAENEYGNPLKVQDDRRGAVISGAQGTGPQLRLTTEHGTITVRKSNVETDSVLDIPKPPSPPAAPLKPQEQ